MLTIRPARALSIGRVTAFVIQKAPNRFVSRTSRQASAAHPHDEVVTGDAGVVDEDVDLAERLERGLDDALGRLRVRGRRPGSASARRPERLDLAGGRGGRLRVALVAERDVGTLAGEPERDRLADPARPTRDQRDLPTDRSRVHLRWAGSGSPGTTSSSGTSTAPGRAIRADQRLRDRVDRVPVDRQADLDVVGGDRGVAGDAAGRVGRPLDRDGTGREARPERDEHDRSPTLIRPSLTASARAIGTDAADVLP